MRHFLTDSETRILSVALGTVIAAVLFTACGDSKKDDTEVKATFSSLYDNVFKSECAECHLPTKAAYEEVKLDVSSKSTAYASLTGAMNITAKPECAAGKYVVASDLTTSAVWAVFDETTREAFSTKVPGCAIESYTEMGASISDSAKSALKEWISNGAKND